MSHKTSVALTRLLGIRYPIVQGALPHGDGPRLAAAISQQGGLGMLHTAERTPEQLVQDLADCRQITDKPLGFTHCLATPNLPDTEHDLWQSFRQELPTVAAMKSTSLEQWIDLWVEQKPALVVFEQGLPTKDQIATLHDAGVRVAGCATHLLEAIALEQTGVDCIIAQGFEAAGPRPTFIGPWQKGLLGIMTLLPLLTRYLRVPIIARGGIVNGQGLIAALALGAHGIQMAQAFLLCPENDLCLAYRQALQQSNELSQQWSLAANGQAASLLPNRLTEEVQEWRDSEDLPPSRHWAEIQQAAHGNNQGDLLALWCGQGAALAALAEAKPVADLMEQWLDDLHKMTGWRY